MKSHKDNEKNLNNVLVQIGTQNISKDILDFIVYTDEEVSYKVSDLFDKILIDETEISSLKKLVENNKTVQDSNDALIIKAVDILSEKISAAEIDISELKEKTKIL